MSRVYTIADLATRATLDAGESQPARLAVIGWPVAHSASPQMHQPALDAHHIHARYIRLAVEPGMFGVAIERLRALDFIGCNVTVPHKLEAMAVSTALDPAARALGAVNTLRFDAHQTLSGFNTDGPGFACAIEEEFGMPLAKLGVAIIGAGGGAGQAIAAQAALAGVPRLLLVNRTLDKLSPLVARLRLLAPQLELTALALDDPALAAACAGCKLLVNTSSVGLQPTDPSILPADCLEPQHLVYDTIYQPTPLLTLAAHRGCRTANGRSMLLHQGALAFQHWFPGSQPLAIMRAALATALP